MVSAQRSLAAGLNAPGELVVLGNLCEFSIKETAPNSLASGLERFDNSVIKIVANSVFECSDIDVFADKFQCPFGRLGIEGEKQISVVVLHLPSCRRMERRFYLLHTTKVKLHRLPQNPFRINLGRLGSLSLRCRYGSGDDRF